MDFLDAAQMLHERNLERERIRQERDASAAASPSGYPPKPLPQPPHLALRPECLRDHPDLYFFVDRECVVTMHHRRPQAAWIPIAWMREQWDVGTINLQTGDFVPLDLPEQPGRTSASEPAPYEEQPPGGQ